MGRGVLEEPMRVFFYSKRDNSRVKKKKKRKLRNRSPLLAAPKGY